jgi:hypothetical protein
LAHHLNRWYDPAIGKWLSDDPLGFKAGDMNLQRYVANRPLTFVDPTGLYQQQEQSAALDEDSANGSEDEIQSNTALERIQVVDLQEWIHERHPSTDRTRPLTKGEKAIVLLAFDGHLDPTTIRIGNKPFMPWVSYNAMTPRETAWFPPKLYRPDFSKAERSKELLFVHEMTHVYQFREGRLPYLEFIPHATASSVNWFDYAPTYVYERNQLGTKPLYEFNFEQQGDIIKHYYEIVRYFPTRPARSAYESTIGDYRVVKPDAPFTPSRKPFVPWGQDEPRRPRW